MAVLPNKSTTRSSMLPDGTRALRRLRRLLDKSSPGQQATKDAEEESRSPTSCNLFATYSHQRMGNNQSVLALGDVVRTLRVASIHIDNHEFWSQIWTLPTSVDDVWGFFTLDVLRTIKKEQPYNFATLIRSVSFVFSVCIESVSWLLFERTLN